MDGLRNRQKDDKVSRLVDDKNEGRIKSLALKKNSSLKL